MNAGDSVFALWELQKSIFALIHDVLRAYECSQSDQRPLKRAALALDAALQIERPYPAEYIDRMTGYPHSWAGDMFGDFAGTKQALHDLMVGLAGASAAKTWDAIAAKVDLDKSAEWFRQAIEAMESVDPIRSHLYALSREQVEIDLYWEEVSESQPASTPPTGVSSSLGRLERFDSGRRPIHWNKDLCELSVDGAVVRKIRGISAAPNVTKILDCFEEDGWPQRIDSPFPAGEQGKQTLRESIRSLNSRLTRVKFEADGSGAGVILKFVNEPQSRTLTEDQVAPF